MSDARLERFKQQADILQRFLASAGIELKRRNALEAIAQIHHAKDWNTLSALPPADETTGVDEQDIWVLTEFAGGFPQSSIAPSKLVAMLAFLQSARLMSDCFPTENVEFGGQCVDAGLPSLWMKIGGHVCLTLAEATRVGIETVEDGKVVDAKLPTMGGLEQLSEFRSIARRLTEVFSRQVGKNVEARRERASRSAVALHIMNEVEDLDHVMKQEQAYVRAGRLKEDPNESLPIDDAAVLSGIERIKLMHMMKALVI